MTAKEFEQTQERMTEDFHNQINAKSEAASASQEAQERARREEYLQRDRNTRNARKRESVARVALTVALIGISYYAHRTGHISDIVWDYASTIAFVSLGWWMSNTVREFQRNNRGSWKG